MYLFLVFMLFINIFLISKVIVFILEFLLINFSNNLHQTKYHLELHNRIPNDENGWNFEIIEEENDEDEVSKNEVNNEEVEENEVNNEEVEENEEENDIKLNDFTFIDDKLD